jgi:hypothetical protein
VCYVLLLDGLEEVVCGEEDAQQDTRAGLALRELLDAMARATAATNATAATGVVVIGACCSPGDEAAPLRRLLRSPGFDLVRRVRGPCERDRRRLVGAFLARLGWGLGGGEGEEEEEEDVVRSMAALSITPTAAAAAEEGGSSSSSSSSSSTSSSLAECYALKLSKLTMHGRRC